jgi:hypothetical protein
MAKSRLPCTKFVVNDMKKRTTPVSPSHISNGYVTMVKTFKESYAKDLEKLGADRLRESEKKATDDAVNTPKHTVLFMEINPFFGKSKKGNIIYISFC